MNNLVNRQTVPAAIATGCFVTLALLAPSVWTVLLAVVTTLTLAVALWRWWSFGRASH
jgi:hypothetical protein